MTPKTSGPSRTEWCAQFTQVEVFKEELVPLDKLMDGKYMDRVRECYSMNLNMPGSMETVDPNRFLPGALR